MALRYLRETAATDLDLDPNNAGSVRIAGLGALWQVVVRGFGGPDLRGRHAGDQSKASAPVARPVVSRVLARPNRGDPHRRQDRGGDAAGGRADGDADRSCHGQTDSRRHATGIAVGYLPSATVLTGLRQRTSFATAARPSNTECRICSGDRRERKNPYRQRRAAIFVMVSRMVTETFDATLSRGRDQDVLQTIGGLPA
jgi:hypothetical protein